MLPLVIIKQKPNFQKWNIQKTIVCILGSSQRASFPKSAASEESGQRPVPRVGAYQGPGKRPLGHCFLFHSLYVVENLPCFNPSKSFPPPWKWERESHGKWSPTPLQISSPTAPTWHSQSNWRPKTNKGGLFNPWLQPDSIRGTGPGAEDPAGLVHREPLYTHLEDYGHFWKPLG